MGGRKDLITAGLTLGALADAEAKAKGKMSAIIATESGSSVSFSAADAAPVSDLTAAIVPVQSGSGDPSPENIRPISGWTECKVTRAGKNLFYIPTETKTLPNTQVVSTSPGTISVTGTGNAYGTLNIDLPFAIHAGNTVYLSGSENGAGTATYRLRNTSTSEYVQIIMNGYKQLTFDVDRIQIATNPNVAYSYTATNLQIELGSTATAYEPYRGDTYTVTFGSAGTVYGGTLDVTMGKLTVDKASVDLGTLSWNYRYNNVFSTTSLTDYLFSSDVSAMCTSYKFVGTVTGATVAYNMGNGEFSFYYWPDRSDRYIYMRNIDYTTKSAFETSLSGVMLVYDLATPIVYHLSPVEIRTLVGQNTIWADTGSVTVKYTADTKAFIDNYIAARRNG